VASVRTTCGVPGPADCRAEPSGCAIVVLGCGALLSPEEQAVRTTARSAAASGAGLTLATVRSVPQRLERLEEREQLPVHLRGSLLLQEVRAAQLDVLRPGDPLAGRAHVLGAGQDVVGAGHEHAR